MKLKAWIEAMRLRTLPVSVAGVIAGTACACLEGRFNAVPALICLAFAVIAQIASNFANEYYDFRNGLDRKGRDGFRRGVTEGDISPESMKRATFILLAADALLGCSLLLFGEWWLIPVGIAIALFAVGYSTGPYPLSHHGLGDIAVVIFFGIVPVTLTAYLQTQTWDVARIALPISVAIGLMGANVLIVNNYRDADDDRLVVPAKDGGGGGDLNIHRVHAAGAGLGDAADIKTQSVLTQRHLRAAAHVDPMHVLR